MAASRFLVRGVIYELRAFLQPIASSKCKSDASSTSRDWSNLLHKDLSSSRNPESVSAADVMARLGLKGVVPGVEERVAASADELKKKKLQEKQALEEIIGTKDSIRAKYVQQMREKKMAADFRREQGKFSDPEMIFPPESSKQSDNSHQLVPGSAALLRYLQERGLLQALVANGCERLESVLNQINKFQFQEINQEEALSDSVLSSICSKWGLPLNQVMLVVCEDCNETLLKSVTELGLYICLVKQIKDDGKQVEVKVFEQVEANVSPSNPKPKKQGGFTSFMNKLMGGTADADDQQQTEEVKCSKDQLQRMILPEFKVADMTELKWIIEDLNGVSYRPTTLGGFR